MNTNVYHLIRLSDESGNGDPRISADDSLDQETSPSLFSPSQNMDPVLSNDESSQSIIGSRLIEINPMNGDEVEVHLRREHIDPDRPNRVRLEGCTNYREVLRIITPHSMSMTSNDTYIHNQNTQLRSITDRPCCIVIMNKIKIFYNI